jgi:hypothetical protein
MKPIYIPSLFLLFLLAPLSIYAQDNDPQAAELTKMRQVLRDTMGQARDAQNQVVTLQAQTAQDDKDKADLQAKVDALSAQLKTVSDQAVADKADMTRQITDLKSQVDDQTGQIGRLNDALKQWKDAYAQASQLAAVNDAARKQYAMQAAILQRTVDDRETKNLALYKLANDILTRYEKFGLGEALEAKEPFVGLTRIKLETLVQDYKDKILDQAVVTSGQTPPLPSVAPTPPAPAPPHVADPNSGDRTASARTTNAP